MARSRKLTKKELRRMASARPSAKRFEQIVNGDFVAWWSARLGGINLGLGGEWVRHPDRASAVRHAREVREQFRAEIATPSLSAPPDPEDAR